MDFQTQEHFTSEKTASSIAKNLAPLFAAIEKNPCREIVPSQAPVFTQAAQIPAFNVGDDSPAPVKRLRKRKNFDDFTDPDTDALKQRTKLSPSAEPPLVGKGRPKNKELRPEINKKDARWVGFVNWQKLRVKKFAPLPQLRLLDGQHVDKTWFTDMLSPRHWLNTMHLDAALRDLSHDRVNLKINNVSAAWSTSVLYAMRRHLYDGEEIRLDGYMYGIVGDAESEMSSWVHLEQVAMILNLSDLHWIAVCVDFEKWMFHVYDCDKKAIGRETVNKELRNLSLAIWALLKKTGLSLPYEGYEKNQLFHWDYALVPQAKMSGDCGLFAFKYVEHMMKGQPMDTIESTKMLQFRQEMAAAIFDSAVTLTEKTGTDS